MLARAPDRWIAPMPPGAQGNKKQSALAASRSQVTNRTVPEQSATHLVNPFVRDRLCALQLIGGHVDVFLHIMNITNDLWRMWTAHKRGVGGNRLDQQEKAWFVFRQVLFQPLRFLFFACELA